MGKQVLTNRQLNRATLARQLLLDREAMAPLDAVEHLVGLQSQVPLNPYTALWSRLVDFDPDALGRLVLERDLVRIAALRGTVHLVTAADCLLLWPLSRPVLERELGIHQDAKRLVGHDVSTELAVAAELLDEQPRTPSQLRKLLAERFPDGDAPALAYWCRNKLALVQIPPRGVWGRTLQVTYARAEHWLGRPLTTEPSIDEVVLRYLAAYGPSTAADVSTWCRLTGMAEVLERLALRTFVDERGRRLWDVPDGLLPDPDIPAPVRFLPEYDNALLSHADRARFVTEDVGHLFSVDEPGWGAVLVDGEVRASWRVRNDILTVHHLPLPKRALAAVEREGHALAAFLGASDVRSVAGVPPS